MNGNGHIFISYSSIDTEYVEQITKAMDDARLTYWKAPESIPTGSNYAKEIPQAIKDCEIFLLVYSNSSRQSIWVEKEIDMAVCCRKKILPVNIDGTSLNDMFRFYLNNVQMFSAVISNNQIINMHTIIKEILNNTAGAEKMEVFRNDAPKRMVDKRSNALRMNRIPINCEYCGGDVKLKSLGVYECELCGKENYDDYYKVRSYIEKYGPAPAMVISKHTGVPRASIEGFKNDER